MHTAISDSQAEHVIVGDVADAINRLPQDPQLKAEAVAVGIERTVQMQHQVGYNASPINIILPWLKDLAACLRGGHITTT
jgi:hypothetical protein